MIIIFCDEQKKKTCFIIKERKILEKNLDTDSNMYKSKRLFLNINSKNNLKSFCFDFDFKLSFIS